MVCKISPVNNSGILTNQDSYPYWKSETRIWNITGTGYVDRSGASFCPPPVPSVFSPILNLTSTFLSVRVRLLYVPSHLVVALSSIQAAPV